MHVLPLFVYFILWCIDFLAYERQNTPVLYVYIILTPVISFPLYYLLAFRSVTAFGEKLAVGLLVATNMRKRNITIQNTRMFSAVFKIVFALKMRHIAHLVDNGSAMSFCLQNNNILRRQLHVLIV
jgi:hypothetical protein